MNNDNTNETTGEKDAAAGDGASRPLWWRQMLSRREANKRIAQIGLAAVVVSTVGVAGCGGGDDEDEDATIEDHDAIELQKKDGWNVGSDAKLALVDRSTSDSKNSLDWSAYNDPAKLLKAYNPKAAQWQPYVVPTLVQSLQQASLKGQVAPVHSASMDDAYSRGLGMKELLKSSKNAPGTLLVVDLPGPESVAYGAALADVADVILGFDNWPHPVGVVPSQQTLGALLYYAQEVEEKAATRPAEAPAVLLLDSRRLNAYSDDSDQFDNRYVAKLPPPDKLQAMKVTTVMYAVPDETKNAESDDINEDFVAFQEKGINVAMIPLTNFKPSSDPVDSTSRNMASNNGHTTVHRTYYYGGGMGMSPWFFAMYPMMMPMRSYGTPMGSPPVSRPTYRPTPRPTMFSSRTVGGRASGIGKAKPTGFGRVSTRTTSSGVRSVGSRTSLSRSSGSSGRSGSFGRSRGGYSG
jgi:hypothetical protein